MRRYREAELLFQTALKSNSKNVDAQLYYARSIWKQFKPDIYADKVLNQELASRSISAFIQVLNLTDDSRIKDSVYGQIADIYRATGDRSKYEQWMLDRSALPDQTREKKVETFIKLATFFANDVTSLKERYEIKNSFPRSWQPVSKWSTEDQEKARASAKRSFNYLRRALQLNPKDEVARPLHDQLLLELTKVDLDIDQ
jgi:hypothetical protein